jgi:phosphatidylserine decarboxylase
MTPKVLLQHLLPHRLLSRLAYRAARSQWTPGKQLLIDQVVRRFGVDLDEAEQPDPRAYPSFNAFFTRALRHGARIADPDPQALLMPADGRISQLGRIEQGRIFAAKGQEFTASELLGDADAARAFACGHFATVYLSPRDYHRVHMPWTGTLRETLHVPGRLFTVAPWGVEAIPRLFARNERLVCHFDCDFGPMAVVMVGAMLVSGVETVWGGEEIPPFGNGLRHRDWRGQDIRLERFAEMARFNYGSTVIVLFPDGAAELESLEAQQVVRVGQRLGTVATKPERGGTAEG